MKKITFTHRPSLLCKRGMTLTITESEWKINGINHPGLYKVNKYIDGWGRVGYIFLSQDEINAIKKHFN